MNIEGGEGIGTGIVSEYWVVVNHLGTFATRGTALQSQGSQKSLEYKKIKKYERR
jgi:hypothetical protein